MKKICSFSGCNTVVEVDDLDRNPPRCTHHPFIFTPKRAYTHHYSHGKAIYKTTQWVRLRNRYARDHELCEDCESRGVIKPGNEVDHIVEIEDGGEPFDYNNLQHLCHGCHRRKTGQQARQRRKKKSLNGFGSLSDF